jgi:hypothetical protein
MAAVSCANVQCSLLRPRLHSPGAMSVFPYASPPRHQSPSGGGMWGPSMETSHRYMRTNVSEEHIASIFRIPTFHDSRWQNPEATWHYYCRKGAEFASEWQQAYQFCDRQHLIKHTHTHTHKKTKLCGLSPRANYIDRATAACWRQLVTTSADTGCHVIYIYIYMCVCVCVCVCQFNV